MEEYKKYSNDDLVEDLGVVAGLSAVGLTSAALFFREGNAAKLNNTAIKFELYANELKKLWDKHQDNVLALSEDRVKAAKDKADAKFLKYKNAGFHYNAQDTPWVKTIVNSFARKVGDISSLREIYNSQLREVGVNYLSQFEKIPKDVRAVLIKNINYIAEQSFDKVNIYRALQRDLGENSYYLATGIADNLADILEEWKSKNVFESSWLEAQGFSIAKAFEKEVDDPRKMLETQNHFKETNIGKLHQEILGDRLTVGEFLEIHKNGTIEQKRQLRDIFAHSVTSIPVKEDALLSLGYKPEDPDVIKTRMQLKNKKGSKTFRVDDIISYVYGKMDAEQQKAFAQMEFHNIRKLADGSFYIDADIKKFLLDESRGFLSLFPFSTLHGKEILNYIYDQPTEFLSKAGDVDPVLARALGLPTDVLDANYKTVGERIYRIDGDNVTEVKELRGKFALLDTRKGLGNQSKEMIGKETLVEKEPETAFEKTASWLGGEVGRIKYSKALGNNAHLFASFNKDALDFIGNVIDELETNPKNYRALEVMNGLRLYDSFIERTTHGLERRQAMLLRDAFKDKYSRSTRMLDYILQLQEPGELFNVLDNLIQVGDLKGVSYLNKSLNRTLAAYMKDPEGALRLMTTESDKYRTSVGKYKNLNFSEILQKELSTEFFLQLDSEFTNSGKNFNDILGELNVILQGKSRMDVKDLAAIAKYRNIILDMPQSRDNYTDESALKFFKKAFYSMSTLANSEDEGSKALMAQVQAHAKKNNFFEEKLREYNKNEVMRSVPDYIHVLREDALVKRFPGAQELIKDINEGHFNKAFNKTVGAGLSFVAQFFSGGSSPENFTIGSLYGSHMMSRLNQMLNDIDDIEMTGWSLKKTFGISLKLGLKPEDARSGGMIFRNLLLKRVAPVFGFLTALDIMDDASKSLTGMSVTEAGVSGLANSYLGIKKITGVLGLDETLKSITKDNAFFEYFAGYVGDEDPEWNTYAEQKKYYESGYSAVRKSRFWAFGSSNEYRGGRISYWEPNTLRLLASDYRNESLYNGSMWTKYSPMRLIDTYYMEHLHYEDRPYPVSGSLFDDNTPWGVILNPILGDILKPKILMHTDRLDDSGVDVKALIYHMNEQVRQKADYNKKLLYVQNGRLRSMTFEAFNAPTYSERIMTMSVNGEYGTVQQNDYETYNTPVPISTGVYESMLDANIENIAEPKLSYRDRINISAAKGNPLARMAAYTNSPLNIIRELNQKVRDGGGYNYEYDRSQGIMVENKINTYDPVAELMENADTIRDLIEAGSTNDYIHQMAVSARMLGGLQGWYANKFFEFGDNDGLRIANAGNMTSGSRRFWDANIGGFGGELMEITRRVIPEYRRFQTYNPLMNTMPDWLPERFRFGDPYCVSKDTLIELNNLQYVEAQNVQENNLALTHNGTLQCVEAKKERPLKSKEKVYELKIASISAVHSKFSENHPILVCRTPSRRRGYSNFIRTEKYEKANLILNALKNGITSKKDLAKICGYSDTNNICCIFKFMYENNLIEDYRKDKHYITLKNYKPFDIELLKRDLKWIKVKDIKKDDYVAYPIPKYEELEITLDLTNYIPEKYPATENYIYISGTLKNKQTAEIYEWAEKNGIKSFNRNERKEFLEENGWTPRSYECVQALIRKGQIPERIPRYIKLNKDIFYSFGFYIAEGYSTPSGIGLAVYKDEEFRVKRTVDGLKQYFPNIRYTFYRNPGTNGAEGRVYGKYIGYLLKSIFGQGAHNKTLPEFFWNAPKDHLLAFFEGYFDGDGCNFVATSGERKMPSERVNASSCNLILLLQIRKLLLRFNIVGSLITKKERRSVWNGLVIHGGTNYSLTIRGQNAETFAELVWGYKENKNSSYTRKPANHTFISAGYLYMRVIDIYECDNISSVLGFQIKNSKSFCTAGLATHNTLVPGGEARLPGRGYESLNELHSDMYGRYGAFDRFKILADIAPYSPEFKFWKKVTQKTVKDPALKEEIDAINERVAEQKNQHDFQKYKYVGRDIQRSNVYVTEILSNGQFKVFGSDATFKLAGARIKANENEKTTDVFSRYVQPGQLVTLFTDPNEVYARNNDQARSINAAIVIDGINIGQEMIDSGDAVVRKSDVSSVAYMSNHSDTVNFFNWVTEAVMHADIPVLHNRWLRANDALEDYLDDYVYGASFQSWDDFIGTFIIPNFRKAAGSTFWTAAAITTDILYNNISNQTGDNMLRKFVEDNVNIAYFRNGINADIADQKINSALRTANMFSDRGALAGRLIGKTLKFGASGQAEWVERYGRRLGNAASLMFSALAAPENAAVSLMSWSRLGYLAGEVVGTRYRKPLTALGAVIGWARNAGEVTLLSDDDGRSSTYIPDSVKERWDMQDYFDRLTYLKYMGLFEEAAERAKKYEHVDIKKILLMQQREAEEIKKAKEEIRETLSELDAPKTIADLALRQRIIKRYNDLKPARIPLEGGEYTESAVLYYNAARSTMYALDETSSMADVIRALPKTDRDYFMEFVQERDPEKRKEILRYASPQITKALKMFWSGEYEEPESMEDYFDRHVLPAPTWGGWNPKVDLADVQAKVIKNEGMTASDFGIYSSQYKDKAVIKAPNIDYSDSPDNYLITKAKLLGILNGYGLSGVEVSIQPREDSRLDVIANVARVVDYNIGEGIESLFGML